MIQPLSATGERAQRLARRMDAIARSSRSTDGETIAAAGAIVTAILQATPADVRLAATAAFLEAIYNDVADTLPAAGRRYDA
jgi:hypothetical protein